MRALTNLLLASGALLGLAGCLPDFSPDPLKNDLEEQPDSSTRADAGKDASRPKDASNATPDSTVVDPGEDASEPVDKPDSGGGDTGDPPPAGCDLRGKWFVNERLATNVLNAIQIANNWYYYEIAQSGSAITVSKSVGCGGDVNGIGGIAAKADDSAAWAAYGTHLSYAGRKGTVTATADGCEVIFEKAVIVRGATVETYRDVSVPLPKLAQEAAGGTPGWEDWDEDDHPGVTLKLSGLASGELYCVTRLTTTYQGPFEKNATLLSLSFDWAQTRENLGSTPDPAGLLRIGAGRDPDESRHVVELAKLSEEQAAGDDLARCERLRGLAKTITPNAAKLE